MAPVNDWESRGTCGIPPSREHHGQGTTKTEGSIKQVDETINTEKQIYVKNPKPTDNKIIFPKDDKAQTEDLEAFSIHKLGY